MCGKYPTMQVDGKQKRVHRVVMEAHIGRELSSSELVHHKNHDVYDNRIENLVITTRSEHKKLHPEIGVSTRLKKIYNFNLDELRQYRIDGLSTHKIANIYGCNQSTIFRELKKHGIK